MRAFPAFGSARAHTRSVHFLKRQHFVGMGEEPPLEGKTSAAYGVGRDSIADGVAVGCPVSAFIATAE